MIDGLRCWAVADVPCIYGMLPWWAQLAICILIIGSVVNIVQAVMRIARWLESWGGMPALLAGAVVLAGFIAWLWKPVMALVGIFGPKPKKAAYEFGRGGKQPSKGRPTIFDRWK